VSRKAVPKRKAGIPLDELLAAHIAGDDRLTDLQARYGGDVVRASTICPKPSTSRKRSKTVPKKAPGARFARPDDSQVGPKSEARLVGYARVSTDEQTTKLQLDALRAAGCATIHEDSASGVSRSRPGLSRALEDLVAGDTLVVWRLDRLGRSLRDLRDISEMLRERDVALRSLTDHIDTGTAAGRMLYAVLGAVAQFERDVLRERTVAGMRAAKRRGEHIGRRPALSAAQVREARELVKGGKSPTYVARIMRVGRSTLYRALDHA
jgi:DNA invertase Pin-like site-specific DNA recombinase